jgi:hypothetical protein
MDEHENDGKQDSAQPERGEEQEPKQAQEESSGLWDTKEHSDAPGPFGTGDEQTEEEAAGNPLAEEDE